MQEPLKAWVGSRDKRKGDASEAVAHRLVYWQMGDPEPPTPCKSPGAAQTPELRACHSTADYNNQVSKVHRVFTHCSRQIACGHCPQAFMSACEQALQKPWRCAHALLAPCCSAVGSLPLGARCARSVMVTVCSSQQCSTLPQGMFSGARCAGR